MRQQPRLLILQMAATALSPPSHRGERTRRPPQLGKLKVPSNFFFFTFVATQWKPQNESVNLSSTMTQQKLKKLTLR